MKCMGTLLVYSVICSLTNFQETRGVHLLEYKWTDSVWVKAYHDKNARLYRIHIPVSNNYVVVSILGLYVYVLKMITPPTTHPSQHVTGVY